MTQRFLIAFAFLISAANLCAQPVNNPYRTMYPQTGSSHWTEVLKWSSIYNVTTYGANGADQNSDQAAVEQAIEAAAQAGGGIVYFPSGSYYFTENLVLKPGVVLRGVTPLIASAKDSLYRPDSKLEFPKFVFDTLANDGRGNDPSKAFKAITGVKGGKNMGVINLDVNRARIEFHPNFDSLGMVAHSGGTTPNYQPREKNRNILIFGVRSNNTSLPQTETYFGTTVPDTSGPRKMRKWQVYHYTFAANLDVFVSENAILVNNRLNDNPTDNFYMPNYKVRNTCTSCTNYKLVGQPANSAWNAENFIRVTDSIHAYFDYSAHYGISVNRNKLVERTDGKRTIKGCIWYPEPYQEPALYAKGFVIQDNWLYKTNRVGIWCAGQGMKIKGNVIRDNVTNGSTTWATPKNAYLNPTGNGINRNFSATFENRGIDFGGSEILIDSNDIMVSIHNFPEGGYGSVDGEGIMDQGNGGGTKPNGITITNNKIASSRDDCTNPTIGLYRTTEIHNIYYGNNEFTGNGRCMQIEADRGSSGPFAMTNVLVENNKNLKTLIMVGSAGGYNAIARNNTGTVGGGIMRLSCFVNHYSNTNLTLSPNGCAPVVSGGLDSTNYPRIMMATPARDTLFVAPQTGFPLLVEILLGTPDSVVFYQDATTRIGLASIGGNNAFLAWNSPLHDGVTYISAIAYFTTTGGMNLKTKTKSIAIRIDDGNPFTNNPEDQTVAVSPLSDRKPGSHLLVFPNPASEGIFVAFPNQEEILSLKIFDVQGKERLNVSKASGFISIKDLPAGFYSVVAYTGKGIHSGRFIRN